MLLVYLGEQADGSSVRSWAKWCVVPGIHEVVSEVNKWGLPHDFSVDTVSEFSNLDMILNSEILIELEEFYHVCRMNLYSTPSLNINMLGPHLSAGAMSYY